jgi:hypothetical protein
MRPWCAALALVMACAASTAWAAEPEVSVLTVRGDALRGRLLALSLTRGAVLRSESGERAFPTDELVQLRFATASAGEAAIYDIELALVGGDRIYGALGSGAEGEVVRLEAPDIGSVELPLESVAGLTTRHARREEHRAAALALSEAANLPEDRLLLTNGDVVSGFVTSISADAVVIDAAAGEQRISAALLVAARLASVPRPRIESQHAVVHLRGGGRLTVVDLELKGSAAVVKLAAGPSATIEVERITSVDVAGGRWEWLSSIEPATFEHTSMLGLDFGYVRDRNVMGGPLVIGGRRYEHGIGVHSRSRLTYELAGAYREFVTSFGLDDDSGPLADVDVMIRADGQTMFERRGVRAGRPAESIRLNTSGVRRIELLVDFGANGDMQDRFNWVEAALVK